MWLLDSLWRLIQQALSIQETHEFLKKIIPKTSVALDEGAKGRSEGIVAKTISRSAIAKLRFEDYERHAAKCRSQ
ncbi:hypothetical protein [Nostoc sp.]|uniref:hypothetical protein n=1 Tax=Nostoc sp. TaxID=1180 RepID=UPI002FF79EAE